MKNSYDFLLQKAERIINATGQIRLVVAESCTGGLLSAVLTEIPGASKVLDRGFVVYSDDAKHEILGVSRDILSRYGACSAEVAIALAEGALRFSRADFVLTTTGEAGPVASSSKNNVGEVYIGYGRRGHVINSLTCLFSGSRSEIRLATVSRSLELLENMILLNQG